MAPMASRVTDAEKDRLIFLACFFECFVTPRIPIDWIVGMLLQIWTFLVDQVVTCIIHVQAAKFFRSE
jgi:hypothetical protein